MTENGKQHEIRRRVARLVPSTVATAAWLAPWATVAPLFTGAVEPGSSCTQLVFSSDSCAQNYLLRLLLFAAMLVAGAVPAAALTRLVVGQGRARLIELQDGLKNTLDAIPGLVNECQVRPDWPRSDLWKSDIAWLRSRLDRWDEEKTTVPLLGADGLLGPDEAEGDRRLQRISTIVRVAADRADDEALRRVAGAADDDSPGLDREALGALHAWLRRAIRRRWVARSKRAIWPLMLVATSSIATITCGAVVAFVHPRRWSPWWAFATENALAFVMLGTGLALAGLVSKAVEHLAGWLTDRTRTDLDDVVGALVRLPLAGTLGTATIVVAWSALDRRYHDLVSAVNDALGRNRVYAAAAILIATYVVNVVLHRILVVWLARAAARTQQTFDDAFVFLLRSYGSFAVSALSGALMIMLFRDELAKVTKLDNVLLPYAVLVGSVTALIGYLSQETSANFFSGMMMQIDKPFSLGDRVRLETGEMCYVREIGVRATKMVDVFENTEITIPNRVIAAGRVVNIARPNVQLRLSIRVAVSPDELSRAEWAVRAIAVENNEVCIVSPAAITHLGIVMLRHFPRSLTSADKNAFRRALRRYARTLAWVERARRAFVDTAAPVSVCRLQAHHRTFTGVEAALLRLISNDDANGAPLIESDVLRYSEEARALHDELAVEPTVHSEFVETESGAPLAIVSLRVFARYFERRDEVAHSLNAAIVAKFAELGIPFAAHGAPLPEPVLSRPVTNVTTTGARVGTAAPSM